MGLVSLPIGTVLTPSFLRFEKMMLSLSELALRIDLERLSESNEDGGHFSAILVAFF